MKSRFQYLLLFGLLTFVLSACGGLAQVGLVQQDVLQPVDAPVEALVAPETAVFSPNRHHPSAIIPSRSSSRASTCPNGTSGRFRGDCSTTTGIYRPL